MRLYEEYARVQRHLGDPVLARRAMIAAAAQLIKETEPAGLGSRESNGAAMRAFLALMQDRLPVFIQAVDDLLARTGRRTVTANLVDLALATIDFYAEVLGAGIAALQNPAQLIGLRTALRANHIDLRAVTDAVAWYLTAELEIGRIDADVDTAAAAGLLLGACLNQAFLELLTGAETVPARPDAAASAVRGLRLLRSDGPPAELPPPEIIAEPLDARLPAGPSRPGHG